jgi:gliding motility-associated-like protein
MNRNVHLFVFAILVSSLCGAQSFPVGVPVLAPHHGVTPEEILDKYGSFEGAVINMSREEWDVMRTWEQYDEQRVREIAHAHKEKKEKERDEAGLNARKLMPPGGCDCWIEPDNTYQTVTTFDWDFTGGAGVNVDCAIGPISTGGWNFSMYGQTYNQFYINSKGTVSFGDYIIDWTPEEFPNTVEQTAQIALFWADTDLRNSGQIRYKVTPDAVYVNFIDVGYFNNHDDKLNSYQLIFTPTTSGGVLPAGFNAQLCYRDVDWAHGDVGGSGGCCGSNPATVGADAAPTTGAHIQYGRFNLLDGSYNGPYGTAANQQDGVDWLDGKSFNLNVIQATGNIPPLPTASVACDTVFLCQGGEWDLDLDFLGPESNQTITVTSTAAPGWVYTVTGGNAPGITGTFTAESTNVGTHTFTITATDNGTPAGVTTFDVVVEVLPISVPALEVTGNFSICAGGSTTLSVGSGFDSYQWSNGNVGTTNTYTFGGDFFVSGFIAQCEAVEYFTVEQSPYFLPDVDVVPPAICPNQYATATVDPVEQQDYAVYDWEGNWNNLGGTVVSGDGTPSAQLTAGTYRLLVTDNGGCQGQRVFTVEPIGSYIPEVTFEPFCDGIPAELVFEGGYSSPAAGTLLFFLQSNQPGGWNGSYLLVTVTGLDGQTQQILTTNNGFAQFNMPILAGESIEISFVASGVTNPDFLSVNMYNCGNQNLTQFNDLAPGIVYSGPTGCLSQPATGTWTFVSGPPGWSFSNTDEWDTVFEPGGYGVTTINFNDDICNVDYPYEIIISEEPTLALSNPPAVLCNGAPFAAVATVEDAGGTATINWPAPGIDNVLTNVYTWANPTETTLQVTVTNECGSASDAVDIVAQNTPVASIDDESLCEGGTVLLDPVSNDTPDLTYTWQLDGAATGVIAPTYNATSSGTYCVTVSNLCGNDTDCAELVIVEDIPVPLESMTIDCQGDGEAVVIADVPAGYVVVWPDGSIGPTWTVPDGASYDGTDICMTYTDPSGCETNTACTYLYIGVPPTVDPFPVLSAPLTLCPEVEYAFDLNANGAGEFTWYLECNGQNIYFEDPDEAVNVVSAIFPPNCWGQQVTLTGLAINPCATAGIPGSWDVVMDACAITIPNVFTPGNGDDMNPSFQIDGLNVYDNVLLQVFNRWGQMVYENYDYRSGDWLADDVEDGTYWYVLLLPNGIDHSGHLTIIR